MSDTQAIHASGRPSDPCAMVIFGASGDLTKRKLLPALYNLAKDNLLSREFVLIGFMSVPGGRMAKRVTEIVGVDMSFNYADYFNATPETGPGASWLPFRMSG